MLGLSKKMHQGAATVDYANVLMNSVQNLFLSWNISILVEKGQINNFCLTQHIFVYVKFALFCIIFCDVLFSCTNLLLPSDFYHMFVRN